MLRKFEYECIKCGAPVIRNMKTKFPVCFNCKMERTRRAAKQYYWAYSKEISTKRKLKRIMEKPYDVSSPEHNSIDQNPS